MPDDGAAVLDAPVVDNAEISSGEPTESTVTDAIPGTPKDTPDPDRQDNRKQPDALRKRIADLRRQADSVTDPIQKKALLDDAKALNDTVGKARAYESVFPTVREVREVKALLDAVGGRDGFVQMQSTLGEVAQIDAMLEAGDEQVIAKLWEEAPQGMPKLVPGLISKLEQVSPQDYQKTITPHAVKFFDAAGFPEAFDQMTELVRSGDAKGALALAAKMAAWFSSQRAQKQAESRPDPEVERLRNELKTRDDKESAAAVDGAYNSVVEHAGPVIDKHLKPIVAKLGLSPEQYKLLRGQVWTHLETTRNENATYKTVAGAKYKQGINVALPYMKQWTDENAMDAARTVANQWYGHQLKNGAVKTANPTANPGAPAGIQRGKEPTAAEIDYGPRGLQAARKAGFKDVGDMILNGKAPLKAGGIRQWR